MKKATGNCSLEYDNDDPDRQKNCPAEPLERSLLPQNEGRKNNGKGDRGLTNRADIGWIRSELKGYKDQIVGCV